eukprot:5488834-Prymnesium_polylepis.1
MSAALVVQAKCFIIVLLLARRRSRNPLPPSVLHPKRQPFRFTPQPDVNRMTFSLLNVMCHSLWRSPKWLSLDAHETPEITKVAVVGCARDATPSSTKMSNMCDNCDSPHSRILKGIKLTDDKVLRVEGDKLCSECYDKLSDEVADFIPRPGFSKPAG